MTDPKTHRTLLTKSGVATIPRDQQGVKFEDYFANAKLPDDPRHKVVYATEAGPILGDPEPVPWSEEHDRRQTEAVAKVKQAIETDGRYAPTLRAQAGGLARETGLPQTEVTNRIIGEFTSTYGKDPHTVLEDQRISQGLPTRRAQQGFEQSGPSHEPEF